MLINKRSGAVSGKLRHGLLAVLLGFAVSPAFAGFSDPVREAALGFDSGGRPTVVARINDDQDFVFAVDTAAQRTTLGQDLVATLGLQPDPNERAMAHGAAGVQELDMYRIPRLEAAGHSVSDGLYMAAAHESEPGSHSHDGILGQEFFTGGVLDLDFEAARMTVSGSPRSRDVSATLPARLMHGGFVLVDITINDVRAVAVIDTGAAESFANLALQQALDVEVGSDGIEVERSTQGITQQESERLIGFRGGYDFNGYRVDAAPVSFTESPIFQVFDLAGTPAVILGMDVLGRMPGLRINYREPSFQILAP